MELEKVQSERGVTEREIESIQEKINDQSSKKKHRMESMEKVKKELESQHRLLKSTKEKIENIQMTKARIRSESDQREQELKKITQQLTEQYQAMHMENSAFQETLEKHGLVAIQQSGDVQDIIYSGFRDLDPSPIIEGRLLKYGKRGRNKPKKKYVVFVSLSHGCYVEWTDS